MEHVEGKISLDASQVASARILLGKSIPDLSSVELTAEVTEVPRTIEELLAQGRLYGLNAEQMFGKVPRK